MIPLDHPAKKIDQVDSEIKDMGVVLHVQEEVYKSTLTLEGEYLGNKNEALDLSSKKF